MLLLSRLLDELEYTISHGNWITENDTDPVFRLAKAAGVYGAYYFRTSKGGEHPASPAVYVAQADDEEQARSIHHRLWNLGSAPFLIIVLQHQVRVYKGFRFDKDDASTDLICTVPWTNSQTFRDSLRSFSANSIDSGSIWEIEAKHLSLDTRVDRHLLTNLNQLGDWLINEKHLDTRIAHALIGKYTYIRYLCDRGILTDVWASERGIDLSTVLSRDATYDQLIALIRVLEDRFNGRIFPLGDENLVEDTVVATVASVFKGDNLVLGQMALDFGVYDFSYIPVELLSSIYEQFLHRTDDGKRAGAYYTPEPLADYVLCEMESVKSLRSGMRVLDPCCGSGVFLVLAYRKLIEKERAKRPDRKLSPVDLREILQTSIYGVERNIDACYVTEFGLLLTLLSYVEPPDLQHYGQFRFPVLHDINIFACDFFDDNSSFWKKCLRFDWVVGNPPWKELDPKLSENKAAISWMKSANEAGRTVARYRICDAFTWRVIDVLAKSGYVGLVIHAKSLVNDQCTEYRARFFQSQTVVKITDFSNLAYVLFGGRSQAPAAILIYTSGSKHPKPHIQHYGPFVANQVQSRFIRGDKERAWCITVCENEMRTVDPHEAETGNGETWKQALWGVHYDQRAMQRLRRLFPQSLNALKEKMSWQIKTGLQLRDGTLQCDNREKVEFVPELEGMKVLNTDALSKLGLRFTIPNSVLSDIPSNMCYVRKGRKDGLKVAHAPHLFWSTRCAAFSDQDFVLRHPQICIAGHTERDAEHLRALSVILNSTVFDYALFFQSASWGSDRTQIVPADVRDMPIPVLSDNQVSELSALHNRIAHREVSGYQATLFGIDTHSASGCSEDLQREIQDWLDQEIERILGIPKSITMLAKEFWAVRYEMNKGKAHGTPMRHPTDEELHAYASSLVRQLDDFAGSRHRIDISVYRDMIACMVEFTGKHDTELPRITSVDQALDAANNCLSDLLRSQLSQWIYIQRSLRAFAGDKVYICKLPRLVDWTPTQARLDADGVVADVLVYGGAQR